MACRSLAAISFATRPLNLVFTSRAIIQIDGAMQHAAGYN